MDFAAYISGLPHDKRTLLYRSPWTALAVFRNLPPLARAYVMRLLFVPSPFPAALLDSWARKSSASAHKSALAALQALDVLRPEVAQHAQQAAMQAAAAAVQHAQGRAAREAAAAAAAAARESARVWALHGDFRVQLQRVVCCGPQLMGADVPAAAADAAPPLDSLAAWAAGQWEALQLYLLGAGRSPPAMPPLLQGRSFPELDVRSLLVEAGLLALHSGGGGVRRGGGCGGSLAVTQRGFQFLLQPSDRQLWAILREYISGAEAASGEELAVTLSFLLQLGFRRVGQPCAWGELRAAEQRMAAHCVQLGLLAVFQADDGYMYYTPTRLASSLCGGGGGLGPGLGGAAGAAGGGGGAGRQGGGAGAHDGSGEAAGGDALIIVESNYRVYAYTRSPVAIAVLELFVKREALLPNLFVGAIRRDSILGALSKGISADELVSYLSARPHPAVAARSPSVPEVVSDQIRLWEASLNRVRAEAAVLYENMESRELYDRALAHARGAGTLLWEDGPKMRFAALEAGHEAMKTCIVKAKSELKL